MVLTQAPSTGNTQRMYAGALSRAWRGWQRALLAAALLGAVQLGAAPAALAQADAGRVLTGTGDLLQTGPTGTNVMDLVIGLKP